MKKNIFIFGFVLIFLFSLINVSGASPYPSSNPFNATRIFSLDDNCDDSLGIENCSNIGNPTYTTTTPFNSGKSLLLDGTGDAVNSNFGANDMFNTDSFSTCFWWKQVGTDSNLYYMGIVDTSGSTMFYYLFHRGADDDTEFFLRSDTGVEKDDSREKNSDTITGNGNYHHICMVKESGSGADKLKIYRNGSRIDDTSDSNDGINSIVLDLDFFYGGRNTDGSLTGEMNAYIDDIIIFNGTALTDGEIQTIALGNYTVPEINFTITLKDYYNNASLSNFSAYINSNSEYEFTNTVDSFVCEGSIINCLGGHDTDWNTRFLVQNPPSSWSNVTVNYTIPTGININSIVMFKDEDNGFFNLTLPNSCLQNKELKLKMSSRLPGRVTYYCLNNSDAYQLLYDESIGATIPYIYGSGVFWNKKYNDSGNGTIITPFLNNESILLNITIEKENYFNSTYLNYNITNDLEAFINGSNITLRIIFNNTNITVNIINTTLTDLNNSLTWVSEDGFFNIYPYPLEPITFNIQSNRSVFETRNFTINFTPRDITQYDIFVEQTLNNITYYDADTSNPIVNATINITYPISGDILELTTNSNGTVFFSYINNDVTEFGNYSFLFNKLGYNTIETIEELNSSNVPRQFEYNITQSTIIINIYDRESGLLLNNTNVTLDLLGVFTNSTTTGTFIHNNISLISRQYTLQASSTGYYTEQTIFDFTNQENITINMYLLNLTSPNFGTLFARVVDDVQFNLQANSLVYLMEYVNDQLGYVSVSSCLTNSNGECIFAIELNVKTYILSASKTIDGQTFSAELNPEIFRIDEEVREIVLPVSQQFDTGDINRLVIEINETFLNNISTINLNYFTTDSTISTVCIEYFRLNLTTFISLNQTCFSGASVQTNNAGFLLNRSNSYQADVYLLSNGVKQPLESFSYPSDVSLQQILKDNEYLIPFILILLILILVLALYLKTISIFFYLVTFLSVGLEYLFPSAIYLSSTVIIFIISVAMIYTSRKNTTEI